MICWQATRRIITVRLRSAIVKCAWQPWQIAVGPTPGTLIAA